MITENIKTLAGKQITNYEKGDKLNSTVIKLKSVTYEDDHPTILEKLNDLIKNNDTTQIEGLVFGEWKDAYEEKPPFLSFLIEQKENFPNLKHFYSGDMTYEESEISWITQTDYSELLKAYPQLETLGFQGGNELRFGSDFQLNNLKEFILRSGGTSKETLQDLIKANTFQNLERLEIWFGTEEYGANANADIIKSLLELSMSKLKHLAFMNSEIQDEIVPLIAQSELLKQLETLDISKGILTDKGGQVLLEGAFDHLKHITCEFHYMSTELTNKLREYFKDKITISEPEEEDKDGDEVYRYVQVGE